MGGVEPVSARVDRLLPILPAPADVVDHYRSVASETLRVLIRRWYLIVGVVLLGVALCSVALLLLPRKYSAEALIQVDFVRVGGEAGSLIATVDAAALAENEVRLIRARPTARNVVLRLGLHKSPARSAGSEKSVLADLRDAIVPEMSSLDGVERTVREVSRNVTVINVARAYLITIAYSGRSPDEAALIANEFAREFFRIKLLQGLQKGEASAQHEVQRLSSTYGDRHPLMVAALEKLEAVRAQARADRAALAEHDVLPPPGFSFTAAQPNPVPSSPRGLVVLGLGTLCAFGLGVAVAIWVDRLRGGFHTANEVQAACGVRCLGTVWDLRDARGPGSAAQSDALHALSLAMELAATGGAPRTFLIAAAGADGSDKQLAAALAEWLSATGLRVLAIDATAPASTMARSGGWHLEEVLADADRARALPAEHADPQQTAVSRGITADVAGPLATSRSVANLLAAATKEYAAVVIRAPPVLERSDAMLLGRAVDICVVAARSGATPRHAVLAAIQRLRDAGARIDGVVLTRNWPSGRGAARQQSPILRTADNCGPHGKDLHNERMQPACARSLPGR
jgi:Mrp family chromosome partitioning ATPase